MPSKWRWCQNCRRWFYPDTSPAPDSRTRPRCPVCQRESVGADEAPGEPPEHADD